MRIGPEGIISVILNDGRATLDLDLDLDLDLKKRDGSSSIHFL